MDLSVYSEVELHGLLLEITREIEKRTVASQADRKLEASIREAVDAGLTQEEIAEVAGRVGKRKPIKIEPEPVDPEPEPEPEPEPVTPPAAAPTKSQSGK